LTLAAIYLSRVGVVRSVSAAALAVGCFPPELAALNIGVGPCWTGDGCSI